MRPKKPKQMQGQKQNSKRINDLQFLAQHLFVFNRSLFPQCPLPVQMLSFLDPLEMLPPICPSSCLFLGVRRAMSSAVLTSLRPSAFWQALVPTAAGLPASQPTRGPQCTARLCHLRSAPTSEHWVLETLGYEKHVSQSCHMTWCIQYIG